MKRQLAALAVVATLFGAPASVTAGPPQGFTILYYSDATFTTVVGHAFYTCKGLWFKYGTETSFSDTVDVYDCY